MMEHMEEFTRALSAEQISRRVAQQISGLNLVQLKYRLRRRPQLCLLPHH